MLFSYSYFYVRPATAFLENGKVLHWNFRPTLIEERLVEDSSGVGVSVSGNANHGLMSESGIELVQASPSLNPGYPCGVVHSGIWRFAGSEDFVVGLRNPASYGGRLQFRCEMNCKYKCIVCKVLPMVSHIVCVD